MSAEAPNAAQAPVASQPDESAVAAASDAVSNLADKVAQKVGLKDNAGSGEKASKPAKEKKAKGGAAASDVPLKFSPTPSFFDHRIKLFEKLKAEQDAFAASQPRTEITITMPDGSTRTGTAWETSPMAVAKEISKSLAERIVISKVDETMWDLDRPLEKSCRLEFFDFNSDEGKRVFWHSSAHILGEAAELHYGCHLCIGPPTSEGFFYEMGMGESEGRAARQEDFPALETLINGAIKEKQTFDRLVVSKENLLEMFKYNKYKVHIIKDKIPDGTSTTVYRCGPMVDLCVGPHIPHSGRIKAMTVLKNSASYFLGDQANDSLQRLYGISFPDTKQMKEYKQFLEEAAKRDHRKIGKEQELFFFHDMSPGSCFWLPHGMRIYNVLQEFIRNEYRVRGFTEVTTPNMYNAKLWQTSGHWENYKDDMFTLTVDKTETFGLKPMNCPGHFLIFGSRERSYRELPMRLAEFGVIHRNEASGALSGLTRVRRFVQDDAHIVCMPSQVEEEMINCFNFLDSVYGRFGFTFKLGLSTRPDKFIGEIPVWDAAEERLRSALEKFVPGKWETNPGDGAFYGPKIDIEVQDAMRRSFQCATIQLDFNAPERFNMRYRCQPGSGKLENGDWDRPVVIHRAILGSLERFIAILTEHFAGKWPFWLSPRQVIVIPVTNSVFEYAEQVRAALWENGLFADADLSDNTLPKKIRNGEVSQYNFILVVGHDELAEKSVNIRNRDNIGQKGRDEKKPLDATIKALVALKESKSLENKLNL